MSRSLAPLLHFYGPYDVIAVMTDSHDLLQGPLKAMDIISSDHDETAWFKADYDETAWLKVMSGLIGTTVVMLFLKAVRYSSGHRFSKRSS